MQPCLRRTWARVGQTPVVVETFDWKRLTAIIALTSQPELFFELVEGSADSARILCFLVDLLQEIHGEIILLWDNSSIHKSGEVKDFLKRPDVLQRLEVHSFPSYAPDLNPNELVNGQLKTHALANFTPLTVADLKAESKKQLKTIAKNKPLLKAFLFSPTHGLFKPRDRIHFSFTQQ